MFELSFIEFLFIAVVGLLVIGPKDLPKVFAAIFKVFGQLQRAVSEVKDQMKAMVDESGIEEAKQELERESKYILDQNGEYQEVFDISEFLPEKEGETTVDEKKGGV